MVGIGFQGKDHMLARISIVNQQGDIIMDKYVKPSESVSDATKIVLLHLTLYRLRLCFISD